MMFCKSVSWLTLSLSPWQWTVWTQWWMTNVAASFRVYCIVVKGNPERHLPEFLLEAQGKAVLCQQIKSSGQFSSPCYAGLGPVVSESWFTIWWTILWTALDVLKVRNTFFRFRHDCSTSNMPFWSFCAHHDPIYGYRNKNITEIHVRVSYYSGIWELGTPKGLWKTVLNSEVVLFLRSILCSNRLGTGVAVLNSQVVPISQMVLKTGFTVHSLQGHCILKKI